MSSANMEIPKTAQFSVTDMGTKGCMYASRDEKCQKIQ